MDRDTVLAITIGTLAVSVVTAMVARKRGILIGVLAGFGTGFGVAVVAPNLAGSRLI